MYLSRLTEIKTTRDMIDTFAGYDHNVKINPNAFYDMKNMTSDAYPSLSPRRKRGTFSYPSAGTHKPNGMIAKDVLCYVDGTSLYIGNTAVSGLTLTDSRKQMISMGAYIIIMPDKKYVNTADTTDYGSIDSVFESSGTVTYELCEIDGTGYENVTVAAEAPSSPSNMDYWIDTSSTPHTLKQYSSTSAMWVTIATTYIKIKASGIGASFEQYDGVKISGIDSTLTQLQDLNNQTSILWKTYHDAEDPSNDYIVVIGILDATSTQSGVLTVSRKMPAMDFITESDNRLWGCRYGTDNDGNVVNEIYACKQGDFKNWNCFMGISTDSYTASCGTDGAFTGAITHLGYPLFFKEGFMHKVYGNYPSNYQVQSTACRGVQKGAGDSLAIVNETLFYKSRNGVCYYDGSLPAEISSAFGDVHYTAVDSSAGADPLRNGAVAGAWGNKYYISMKSEEDNKYHLFVYDSSKGLWHREDNTRVVSFCACKDIFYYIPYNSTSIKMIAGSDTETVEWMAETGLFTYPSTTYGKQKSPDKKYVSRIVVRMSLEPESRVMIYAKYDSDGDWEHLYTAVGTNIKSFAIPLKPRRCDHLRLKFEGMGEAKIYSIAKTYEQGSDF